MDGEIKIDVDEVTIISKPENLYLQKMDYNPEWLTRDSVESANNEMNKCMDNCNAYSNYMLSFISKLDNISQTNPPNISDDIEGDEEKK